jgi:hypothetical protein
MLNAEEIRGHVASLRARTEEAIHLISAWFNLVRGAVPVGYVASVPTRRVLLRCERDTLAVIAANVYTLFDPLGTNCTHVLQDEIRARNLLETYIAPTWSRLRKPITALRANIGHHAPYHARGKSFAESLLDGVSPGDIVCLTEAVRRAVSWVTESECRRETATSYLPLILPIQTAPLETCAALETAARDLDHWIDKGAVRTVRTLSVPSVLHWLGDWSWRLPGRLAFLALRALGRAMFRRHVRTQPIAVLPAEYETLRDHFLATNSLFLLYYSHVMWNLGFHGAFARRVEAHTLLLTWYSHLYSLFEEGRVSFRTILPSMGLHLPPVTRWFYFETVLPTWLLYGREFERLRNQVGFHRSREHRDAERRELEFLNAVPPESTTYLMRMLYIFFWTIEEWQSRTLDTVTVPHKVPIDALDPRHFLSPDRAFYRDVIAPYKQKLLDGTATWSDDIPGV